MTKNSKTKNLRLLWSLGAFVLAFTASHGIFGQKNATSIFGPTPRINKMDEKNACYDGSRIAGSKYCDLYKIYTTAYGNNDVIAKDARNRMLDLVKVDLDAFFDEYKNKRETRTKWLETIFDLLGVAGDLGGSIINGERVKTIISASSGALNASRNKLNNNFRLLEYQVMINQMITDRIKQWTLIIKNKGKDPSEYGWDAAKDDLLQYFICGTFNNSLNSLVETTGTNISDAKTEQLTVLGPTTKKDLAGSQAGKNALKELSDALKADVTKITALGTLRGVVTELSKDARLHQLLEDRKIDETSTGEMIIAALIALRRDLTIVGRDDLVNHINDVLADATDK